jgi:hypothetical protein
MPWHIAHAFTEAERSSWTSTCTFSETSGDMLFGARGAASRSGMPQ